MTDAMPLGLLVLFGGPAGAGKSTLARAWCAARPRAAQSTRGERQGTVRRWISEACSEWSGYHPME